MSKLRLIPEYIKKLQEGGPADENEREDWYECEILKYVEKIKNDYMRAKKVSQLNEIIKKYNIKIYDGINVTSALTMKKKVKQLIIEFTMNEPEDVFDYAFYVKHIIEKK